MKQLKPYLSHILEEAEYLLHDSAGLSYSEFENNETLKRSFVRALEVIGEAAKSIPGDFREKYPGIPWKDMAGLRDVLIHHYFGINYMLVWDVVKNKVPKLKDNVQTVISELEEDDHSEKIDG